MAGYDDFPPQARPEIAQNREWYDDGIQRTVIEYPPQEYAPGGSHNVFYNQPGDTIRLMREESNADPSTSGITPVYGLSCAVVDGVTGQTSKRYYYISHDHGVILVDRGDHKPLQPVQLDRLPGQIVIGAPLPAAKMSDKPVNPSRKVVVTSLILLADQWRQDMTGTGAEVRPSPFIDHTLPEGRFPRQRAKGANPLVRVLPQFRQAAEKLSPPESYPGFEQVDR
jgi:hypothetical protein